ncbi:MAG TPA: ferric reductase-like transmembrane domain-containing protein [Trebonia sp.]|nr:ferric reductase-like transmembrane domain-containing protein [Trebonia sp.]
MSGINSSTAFWYASRATGVVALLLLTAVMLLGLLVTRQKQLPGLPRFAVSGLHRNVALLATAFVAVHVLTAVADGFVTIPLTATVIPLTSSYERFWLGLGAVSFDLMIATVVTSLLRRHLSRKAWRGIHLTAYACWPVALFHSIFASKDLQHGFLLLVGIGCALVVIAAALWRVAEAGKEVPRAQRVGLLMTAVHARGLGRVLGKGHGQDLAQSRGRGTGKGTVLQ